MSTEKRKHKRVSLPATASISDAVRVCEGDIVDVSFGGMAIERVRSNMLINLPTKFTAVVSFKEGNAKVIMVPKWYKKEAGGAYSTVGFKIIGPFDAWETFIIRATGLADNSNTGASFKRHSIDAWGTADTKYLYR